MVEILTIENLIALITLTSLEIVLGIDNIVFIAILVERLPEKQQAKGRQVGLLLAMVMRILLLLAIGWVMGLKDALFSILSHDVSGRDLIMLTGGMFLIGKATLEIHSKFEEINESVKQSKKNNDNKNQKSAASSFAMVIIQIMVLDIVFSLDSVITAVGMAQELIIMIAAVIIAVLIMMIFAGAISRFIKKYPTLKMLALAFLILVGVLLVAEGFGVHVNKGYIYFAMAFSLAVELLNLKILNGLRMQWRQRKSSK